MFDPALMYFVLFHPGSQYSAKPRAICSSFESVVGAAAYEIEQEHLDQNNVLASEYRSDWQVVNGKVVPQRGRSRKQIIDACCRKLSDNARQYNAWPVLLFSAETVFIEAAKKAGVGADAMSVASNVQLGQYRRSHKGDFREFRTAS